MSSWWDPSEGKMVMSRSLPGESKVPQTQSRLWGCFSYTGTLTPGTWPFPTLNALRQVPVWTEALPTFGKEKEEGC